jgi:uncharacterized protein (TIGR00255 family)
MYGFAAGFAIFAALFHEVVSQAHSEKTIPRDMIESMTGFGSGDHAADGFHATVEMRSVNSRFIEISLKLPREFNGYELEAREFLRKALQRGKISVMVQLERENKTDIPLRVNLDAAKAYSAMLNQVRTAAGIDEPIRLEHLLKFNDVLETARDESEETARAWKVIYAAMEIAVKALREMRRKEGDELKKDFQSRIHAINTALDKIVDLSVKTLAESREKLRTKVRDIITDETLISKERIEFEIVMLSDKMDITEENVRFRSHNKFFLETLNQDEAVGRRLNFLLQEQGREANTIASKSQHPEISQLAVFIKEELEKIREQVQNIE